MYSDDDTAAAAAHVQGRTRSGAHYTTDRAHGAGPYDDGQVPGSANITLTI